MDPLKVYCETCDKVICRDCTISESHSMHKYRLLSECYTEHHQEIQDELQGIERKMADIETAIAALAIREGMIIDEAEDIKEEIQMHTKQVIEGANRSERQLIHELNSIVQKKTTLLNNQKEEAEKVQKQLKTCKELIEQRLNEWNDQQILMEKQRMMNRMKRLSQFIEPTKFLPLERSDLQFTKDHTTERGIGELSSQTFEKAVLKMPVCSPKVTSTATLALQSNNGSHFSLPSLFVSSFLFSPTCNNIPTTCEITESQQPGEYNISFTSCTRGQYQLIVQVGGMDIHGSPFIFSVTDKPSRILSKINGPRGIAVCENGDIIVAECDANCISIFNKNGKKSKLFASKKNSFVYPRGVAISADGYILVTDNQRIQKFALKGDCIESVCTSKKEQKLNWPIGIAVHSTTGEIFVTDSDDKCIIVYDRDLTYSYTITLHGDETFKRPRFAAFDKKGFLYVADSGNHCITKLTVTGEFVCRFGSRGSLPGQLYLPYSVSVDQQNLVYVAEEGNHRVSIFDSDGNFQDCFGGKGKGDREFDSPCCIATDSYDNLYVSDTNNSRIIVF